MKKLNMTENGMFLIAELLFCLAFLSACEIPNWTRGPYSPNQCVDRWMFAGGLFFPSGIEAGLKGYNNSSRSSRPSPRKGPDKIE